jgi:hypothetical protein
MAVGVLRDLPGIPAELYDAVVREMDLDAEPAAGLIFHTAGPAADGTWREYNVWESREAWDTFYAERILPAVIKVLGKEVVMNGPRPPESRYMDVHHQLS